MVAALNAAGLTTGTGRPFDLTAVRWLRFAYRLPLTPPPRTEGDLTVADVADRLGIARDAVYHWIERGQIKLDEMIEGVCMCRFRQTLKKLAVSA